MLQNSFYFYSQNQLKPPTITALVFINKKHKREIRHWILLLSYSDAVGA